MMGFPTAQVEGNGRKRNFKVSDWLGTHMKHVKKWMHNCSLLNRHTRVHLFYRCFSLSFLNSPCRRKRSERRSANRARVTTVTLRKSCRISHGYEPRCPKRSRLPSVNIHELPRQSRSRLVETLRNQEQPMWNVWWRPRKISWKQESENLRHNLPPEYVRSILEFDIFWRFMILKVEHWAWKMRTRNCSDASRWRTSFVPSSKNGERVQKEVYGRSTNENQEEETPVDTPSEQVEGTSSASSFAKKDPIHFASSDSNGKRPSSEGLKLVIEELQDSASSKLPNIRDGAQAREECSIRRYPGDLSQCNANTIKKNS